MTNKVLTATSIVLLSGCLSAGSPRNEPVELFASPNGAENSTCTNAEPCTLGGALLQARAINQYIKHQTTITVKDGVYTLSKPLALNAELDSGTPGQPVVIRAEAGQHPVISAGVRIEGWQKDPGNDLHWVASTETGLDFRQLYVNGLRAMRARTHGSHSSFQKNATGYTATDALLASYKQPTVLEFVSVNNMRMFRCSAQNITGAAIKLEPECFARSQQQFVAEGDGMGALSWIENAYEFIDAPGEWYHDKANNKLYYYPRAGEVMPTAEVIVPTLETLFSPSGTVDVPLHDIHFEGITFRYTGWTAPSLPQGYAAWHGGALLSGNTAEERAYVSAPAAVSLTHATRVNFRRCHFEHLGANAVNVGRGVKESVFEGNRFVDISGSALRFGDTQFPTEGDERNITENINVRNNEIDNTGVDYYDHPGIAVAYARKLTIEHNRVHRSQGAAVHLGPGVNAEPTVSADHAIGHNLLSYACLGASTCGIIYAQGPQPNSVIENNYLHNHALASGGILLMKGASGFTVRDNALTSTSYWAILQLYAEPYVKNNILENNISDSKLTYCSTAVQGDCTDSTYGNRMSGTENTPVLGWSAQALVIMNQAGLQSEYLDLLPTTEQVELEHYNQGGPSVGYYDSSTGNAGASYRTDDVDIYASPLFSNGYAFSLIVTTEWQRYNVDIHKGGNYQFRYGVGTADAGAKMSLYIDGAFINTADLPMTGGYYSVTSVIGPTLKLLPGSHQILLQFTGTLIADYFSYSLVP